MQVVKPEALVTAPCRVQSFDLATMTAADQDFSAEFCLQASEQGAWGRLAWAGCDVVVGGAARRTGPAALRRGSAQSGHPAARGGWIHASTAGARDGAAVSCHAVVLWFETAFTDRFCRERPVLLDTSPACTPTHWAQVVLTLR